MNPFLPKILPKPSLQLYSSLQFNLPKTPPFKPLSTQPAKHSEQIIPIDSNFSLDQIIPPWQAPINSVKFLPWVKLNTEFKFSPSDLEFCIKIGSQRYLTNRKAQIKEQKYSNRSGIDNSVIGVLGEYAIMKLYNFSTQSLLNTKPCSAKNDRGDIKLNFRGQTFIIDVKSPLGLYHPLLVPIEKVGKTDFYCLFTLERINDYEKSKSAQLETDCTFSSQDQIKGVLRGFIPQNKLIHKVFKFKREFYQVEQEELLSLESCLLNFFSISST